MRYFSQAVGDKLILPLPEQEIVPILECRRTTIRVPRYFLQGAEVGKEILITEPWFKDEYTWFDNGVQMNSTKRRLRRRAPEEVKPKMQRKNMAQHSMPLELVEIKLLIVDLVEQKLQDIDEAACMTEGLTFASLNHSSGYLGPVKRRRIRKPDGSSEVVDEQNAYKNPVHAFAALWDVRYKREWSFSRNPNVFAITFETVFLKEQDNEEDPE